MLSALVIRFRKTIAIASVVGYGVELKSINDY